MTTIKPNITVALVGNPNTGKSTLFNSLTGLNQKTGNYAGVTVDKLEGFFNHTYNSINYKINVIDLPGTYSLYPKSIEEEVTTNYLLNNAPDVVVVVLDSSNLERNLLIATQVIDLKLNVIFVFNFYDEVTKQNIEINIPELEKAFDTKIICTDSRSKSGMENLKNQIINAQISNAHFYDINKESNKKLDYKEILKSNNALIENSDKLYRLNTINYLIKKYLTQPNNLILKTKTKKIDTIITHPVFGYLILLFILFIVFQFIFYVAELPMNWIENCFLLIQNYCSQTLPHNKLTDLIINGVIPGVSGVFMFIPQIAILFCFIFILEDSGYMARASFIMDKLMRKFGLSGKSVIPLISGTACAVPSIMATRSISNTKEKLITIFVLPLISCSARLPIYTLFIAMLYPNDKLLGFINAQGLVLFAFYLLGFVLTVIVGFIASKLIKSKEASIYIMELPIYRKPKISTLLLQVFTKVKVFVVDAGKIIFSLSIVLWFLTAHGPNNTISKLNTEQSNLLLEQPQPKIDSLLKNIEHQKLESSYLGVIGKSIEPIIKPLGFNWKIGIAILSSFAAREVFVGTMSTIYQSNNDDGGMQSIKQKLNKETNADGTKSYSPATCWSLLVFYAIALQCMSTVAIVKRESKSWFFAIFQFVLFTLLAYFASYITFQTLN